MTPPADMSTKNEINHVGIGEALRHLNHREEKYLLCMDQIFASSIISNASSFDRDHHIRRVIKLGGILSKSEVVKQSAKFLHVEPCQVACGCIREVVDTKMPRRHHHFWKSFLVMRNVVKRSVDDLELGEIVQIVGEVTEMMVDMLVEGLSVRPVNCRSDSKIDVEEVHGSDAMRELKLDEIGENILRPNVCGAQMKPALVGRDTTIGHSTPSAGEESTLCRFRHWWGERRATEELLFEVRGGAGRRRTKTFPKAGQTAACDAALLTHF